jgi:protein-tyrosine phosphatase
VVQEQQSKAMSWLSNLFSVEKKQDRHYVHDFSMIGTDIHSHLIPGIDDGVQTMEESIHLLAALSDLGIKKVVTTPHIMSDYFRNTPEIILNGLQNVREAIAQHTLDIQIDAAAEYYLDDAFISMLEKDEKFLTIGGKYILFEVSYINPPENIYGIIFELSIKGYTPLLAHPERYPYWYGKPDVYEKLKECGAKFQLNTNSLSGYYGPAAKKCAEFLIDRKMIEFIGSDMHGVRHLEALRKVPHEKYFRKLCEQGVLNNTL